MAITVQTNVADLEALVASLKSTAQQISNFQLTATIVSTQDGEETSTGS